MVADEISRIHVQSRGTYGKRRIRAALLAECEMIVNHKLVASIMSDLGIFGLPRRKRRGHPMLGVSTPADLVNRAFTAARPNELWCTDITEHPAMPAIDERTCRCGESR
ncbi:IS3 family transposase [Nocardia sp. NBC_00881]|nr:IS3 family transposase [Nocardia sp. NBC_00881]